MKLYYTPGACSQAPHIAIHELGLPYEAVKVDLVKHTLPDGTDYRAINPKGYVPTLELDDGRCLTESRAICGYIEALHPEPNLMGADAAERAFDEMWDRRAELMFAMPLMMWVRHGNPILAAV